MPAVVFGVVAAGYACYASVGPHVLGFLPEYAKEEGLESGSRYFLLTLARHSLHWEALPTGAFYAFAALLLLGLALWAFWRSEAGALAMIDGGEDGGGAVEADAGIRTTGRRLLRRLPQDGHGGA